MFYELFRIREGARAGGRPAFSVLAMMIAGTLYAPTVAAASSSKEQTMTVNASSDSSDSDNTSHDYSRPLTKSGTKMQLAPRDVPQSVSTITKQRMQDQNLQSLTDVLTNTTGVSAYSVDSNRTTFYSRGFMINKYLYDEIPTTISNVWNFGDATSDTALYDRIEVTRGATALLTGTGNPSAAVNMVRKHADSKTFTGNLSASYGSWDKQRYVMDLSAPLTESGNVRGRVVAGYQDNDSWLDRYHFRKKFLYGVVDADLTDSTTLSLGYEYQQGHTSSPTWGGLPPWYSNGSTTHYDRSFSVSPSWAYSDNESKKAFATLTQRFDNGWEVKLNGTHAEATLDSKMTYPYGYPDQVTGQGVTYYGGWNRGKRKVDAGDLYANGPFELFGRQHQLIGGLSYSREDNKFWNSSNPTVDYGDFNHFDGSLPDEGWSDWKESQHDTIRQKMGYLATRLSLADPLNLILGATYTDWQAAGSSGNLSDDNLAPYAGLVYDINDTYSAYVSYTSIFQPQTRRDGNGQYLAPMQGKSYETGIKGDWNNGRLSASLSLFRTDVDKYAVATENYVPGTTETAYDAVDGTKTRGVDFEVNGALTDNWQMTFGASRFYAVDNQHNELSTFMPRTTMKLFTSYRPAVLRDLTLGGGVNWQNSIWQSVTGPDGSSIRASQGSYALVNLFARYQLTKQLAVQGNVNNLFDRSYYDYIQTYAVYGAPRNFSVSLDYKF
ncbi:ferric-rhodotorulic acid/ferric-coprogen receptor FhuE [Erwinia sp. OLTSP20]|uniref:ferric-rhodotorulic acid/ferric-coprogen receptor FhuE n=1 Tax=unclassified Erwinia TaxID=2622719 RepID=UPI000C1818B9|nr:MULTISPECIES: ferric-rhodotorulic acid/ferric-coprogen receptor FhuE [unclassified Erwinia]PIJ50328.1 ferric-rhodotorulic acid/ferric-coprogen receptor FhuE [Erwinia sp. OAMSP11]PIJ72165.1 ferric-rhodotorulic acid/ferric-coprogen receptor FhuE [Erwinia sp. OLSSP12]PIJ81456.1 ferric-rhodotorulic acid/ferric-coprogen receptor FhuE [Erwinia sp. OLCASP19]PIJ84162.1 ferric-rhodotorulic acid/ferric-coprogen receptor FhuE [Erwinia sp. OLMTSP26]PIJ85861.1 ferric-rhodotorulic acid/ferric-coprogen re